MRLSILKTFEDPEMVISKAVNCIREQAESNYDEIHFVRAENAQFRSDLDLIRAMLVNNDTKMENMRLGVTYLRARSTRGNILIHKFSYTQCDNLMQIIPEKNK